MFFNHHACCWYIVKHHVQYDAGVSSLFDVSSVGIRIGSVDLGIHLPMKPLLNLGPQVAILH